MQCIGFLKTRKTREYRAAAAPQESPLREGTQGEGGCAARCGPFGPPSALARGKGALAAVAHQRPALGRCGGGAAVGWVSGLR